MDNVIKVFARDIRLVEAHVLAEEPGISLTAEVHDNLDQTIEAVLSLERFPDVNGQDIKQQGQIVCFGFGNLPFRMLSLLLTRRNRGFLGNSHCSQYI